MLDDGGSRGITDEFDFENYSLACDGSWDDFATVDAIRDFVKEEILCEEQLECKKVAPGFTLDLDRFDY